MSFADRLLAEDPQQAARNGHRPQQQPPVILTRPENQRPKRLSLIDFRKFAESDYRLNYLVKGVLTAGQNCIIGGGSKTMKTSIAVDLALSIGTGQPFLGEFTVPNSVRVAMLSGESGGATLQETARRIAFTKGVKLPEADVLWGFRLPRISAADDLLELRQLVTDNGIKVLIVDPLYLVMLDEQSAGQATNVLGMGPRLLRLDECLAGTGCTIVCLHHSRKQKLAQYDPMELEDLAMAGFAEWARQWILLARRERYEEGSGEHRLWLSVGGSAGHNGLWGVDVTEGNRDDHGGRKWLLDVTRGTDIRRQKSASAEQDRQAKQDEAIKGRQAKIMETLRKYPGGLTLSAIGSKSGINRANTEHAVELLLDEELIVECECQVSNHKTKKPGYKIPKVNHSDTQTGPLRQAVSLPR